MKTVMTILLGAMLALSHTAFSGASTANPCGPAADCCPCPGGATMSCCSAPAQVPSGQPAAPVPQSGQKQFQALLQPAAMSGLTPEVPTPVWLPVSTSLLQSDAVALHQRNCIFLI